MDIFGTIFSNIIGYDGLIILLGIINLGFLYPLCIKSANSLSRELNPTISTPVEEILRLIRGHGVDTPIDLHRWKADKERSDFYFNFFTSFSSIFPLLGILGTILSLISLRDLTSIEVGLSFTKALTSTFWGLLFAITFKALEGVISSKIEHNNESLRILVDRLNQYESRH